MMTSVPMKQPEPILHAAQPVQADAGRLGSGAVEGDQRQQPAARAGQRRLVPHRMPRPRLQQLGDVGGKWVEDRDLLRVHLFEVELEIELFLQPDDHLDEAERVDRCRSRAGRGRRGRRPP